LGIIGSVVSLRWNKLQLLQDADTKHWYVDQSKLLFRKGAAQTNAFEAIDGSFDAGAVLRRFFKYRTGIADRDILFESADFLKDNNMRIPVLAVTPYLSFGSQVKSFYHKLLVYRINRLNRLCEISTYWGTDISYALTLYLDAHIPLMHLFETDAKISSFVLKYSPHEEVLPDATWCIINAALGTHTKNDLSQVFSRALPEMAQSKGLNLLLKKLNKQTFDFMKRIVLCSMLGNYRHANERPRFVVRCEMIKQFNDVYFRAHLQTAGQDNYLGLYALREYTGMLSTFVPVFSVLMSRSIQWNKQNLRIYDMMRAMRITLNAAWSNAFSDTVSETLKKHYKRLPKRKLIPRGRGDHSNLLVLVMSRTVNKRNLKRDHGTAFSTRELLEGLASPVEKVARLALDADVATVGARLLQDFVVKPKKTSGYYVDAALLSDDKLKLMHDALLGVDAARTTRVVALPSNMLRAQLDAVKRRFKCESDDDPRVARTTSVMVCPCCHEVKNFVLKATERDGKKVGHRACGWHKLLFDHDAGVTRCAKTDACRHFNVVAYDVLKVAQDGALAGGVLVGRFGTVVVSPCCGQLVNANALSTVMTSGQPTFDCPACAVPPDTTVEGEPDPKKCAFCFRDLRGQNAGLHLRLMSKEKVAQASSSSQNTPSPGPGLPPPAVQRGQEGLARDREGPERNHPSRRPEEPLTPSTGTKGPPRSRPPTPKGS
jgi:hypothetical protein